MVVDVPSDALGLGTGVAGIADFGSHVVDEVNQVVNELDRPFFHYEKQLKSGWKIKGNVSLMTIMGLMSTGGMSWMIYDSVQQAHREGRRWNPSFVVEYFFSILQQTQRSAVQTLAGSQGGSLTVGSGFGLNELLQLATGMDVGAISSQVDAVTEHEGGTKKKKKKSPYKRVKKRIKKLIK